MNKVQELCDKASEVIMRKLEQMSKKEEIDVNELATLISSISTLSYASSDIKRMEKE